MLFAGIKHNFLPEHYYLEHSRWRCSIINFCRKPWQDCQNICKECFHLKDYKTYTTFKAVRHRFWKRVYSIPYWDWYILKYILTYQKVFLGCFKGAKVHHPNDFEHPCWRYFFNRFLKALLTGIKNNYVKKISKTDTTFILLADLYIYLI